MRGNYPPRRSPPGLNGGFARVAKVWERAAESALILTAPAVDLPAQSEIQGEPRVHLEIILDKACVVVRSIGLGQGSRDSFAQKHIAELCSVLCRTQAKQEIREAEKQEDSSPRARGVEIKLRPNELESGPYGVPGVRPCDLVRGLELVDGRIGVVIEISANTEKSATPNSRDLCK